MISADNSPVSLWDGSAEEPDHAGDFNGDHETELAIVGGGFTGLSTALHAASAGIACHVLEARRIGHGGSGRNVGLVNAGLWLPPQEIRVRLGDTAGAALVRLLGDGPEYVFSLIEKYQIRCEPVRAGTLHAAHSSRGNAALARRAAEWQRLGAPVRLLSREETAEKVGSSNFAGGLLDNRAGTINPMGYARGLARAALAAGARISTGAEVERLERQGDRWILKSARGSVTARHVVIATNAYSDRLWPGLAGTITTIEYFQLATEPLGDRVAHILKERQGLWDTAPIMTSLRRDATGRLIIGSMGRVVGGTDGLSGRWAARQLKRFFPELGSVRFDAAWHGRIAMTPDHLPRIYRLAEGLYAPIGYNGRGIAPGTVFGKALADLVAGGGAEDLPVAITEPKGAPGRSIMAPLYRAVFTANQLWRSL